ncbi:hypothetical protein NL676_008840 [Syzygium grande]|nr:hypothetical protein NL676_008840 [Syzygium grande]
MGSSGGRELRSWLARRPRWGGGLVDGGCGGAAAGIDKSGRRDSAVLNGDLEEGPWMFRNTSLGVLLPTNLDEDTSSQPGWNVESNRAVRYIDSTISQFRRASGLSSSFRERKA